MPNASFGLIFDMDGVIIDSNPFHDQAIRAFCQQHGVPVTEHDLQTKVYGRMNQDWIPAVLGRSIEPEVLNELAEEKEAAFRELMAPFLKLLPGLYDLLEQARDYGIPMAVATSAPWSNVDWVLTRTDIKEFFDAIIYSALVTKGKPDPEIYLTACDALDLAPERCIVFEDSFAGVKSGKAAGCRVVGITTSHTPGELPLADRHAPHFSGMRLPDLANWMR